MGLESILYLSDGETARAKDSALSLYRKANNNDLQHYFKFPTAVAVPKILRNYTLSYGTEPLGEITGSYIFINIGKTQFKDVLAKGNKYFFYEEGGDVYCILKDQSGKIEKGKINFGNRYKDLRLYIEDLGSKLVLLDLSATPNNLTITKKGLGRDQEYTI